jgi:FMN-dependent oxidoreductase (nitrilotriacetate monooxygenase family)
MFLNVLTQAIPSPFFEGLWRHDADETAAGYRSLPYWVEVARMLDDAGVDALFLADIHGTFGVYGGSHGPAVRHAVQSPSIDPTLIVPAMAAATRHLGFAVTYSTTFHEPYQAARVFSTLDHLTGGRVGWNIVTSDMRVADGTGLAKDLSHEERYERADEFVDIAVEFWEESWADGAVVADPAADLFADPAKVRPVTRKTRWFDIDVPHQCEPSPQRTPVLYQAGASPRGRAFAARHAEVAFVTLSSFQQGRTEVDLLRAEAAEHGRELKVLQGSGLLVAATDAEVRALADDYVRLASREGLTAKWCGWAGVDLDAYPDTTPIASIPQENLHSVRKFLGEVAADRELTVGDLREHVAVPRRPNRFSKMLLVGTPTQVADRMTEWIERTGIDGFNLTPLPTTLGLRNLCTLLMPELRRRGLVSEGPTDGETLRERYFGPGHGRYRRAPDPD